MSKAEDLTERLIQFGVRSGNVVDALPDTRLGRHIAGQLVRAATSPAPNYAEGCAAESRADFAHKVNVSLKEMRESCVWLRTIIIAEMLPGHRLGDLLDEGKQLCNILGASVATARGKRRRQSSEAN